MHRTNLDVGPRKRMGRLNEASVISKVATDLTGKGIVKFQHVNLPDSLLVTDEYRGITQLTISWRMKSCTLNNTPSVMYTPTIEGFWALIKRAESSSLQQEISTA